MSTLTGSPAESASPPEPILSVQFDDLEQQHLASSLGMWMFLATEVMFFGGLILAYVVYRATSPREFAEGSKHLNLWLGCINTVVLLGSSFTMAMAVRFAQLGERRKLILNLVATAVLGAAFLGIKAVEYTQEYHEHLIPGLNFAMPHDDHAGAAASPPIDERRFEMFFVLYFFMTGLHAIHLIIGIALVGVMATLVGRRWFSGNASTQIDVTGLYWHFVDVVWVFLYPLLYLIDVQS